MLLNDFYVIDELTTEEGKAIATVSIDKNHKIFNGHFPGQPVVPGVCLTQMVKEVLQKLTNEKLMLTKGSNLKFMKVVNPTENSKLKMNLTFLQKDGVWGVSCNTAFFDDTVAFKFKGEFSVV